MSKTIEQFLSERFEETNDKGINNDNLSQIQGYMEAEIKTNRNFNSREKPCEKCGGKTVYVGSMDVGGINIQYDYWKVCLNCLDSEIESSGHAEQWETWLSGAGKGVEDNPYL